jgi:hypothetical protein
VTRRAQNTWRPFIRVLPSLWAKYNDRIFREYLWRIATSDERAALRETFGLELFGPVAVVT